jgi:hypothetical protein
MEFVLLAIIAVVLYVMEYKIPALLLFFFFLTSGFNLIPEEVTEFAFISKGADYAFLILLGIIGIDFFCIKDYFQPDKFFKYLIPFGLFLIICIFYNKFSIHVTWTEIIRACRYLFFWMAYFVFRNMEKEQLEKLLKYLFYVTVFLSTLFLLQQLIRDNILVETNSGGIILWGMNLIRFYNQPDMIHFVTFMAIYHNPCKGRKKVVTTILLIAALLGAFHRSLLGAFIVAIAVGYIIRLPRLQRIKVMATASILLLFVIVFAGIKFVKSRTYIDLQSVASGNFTDLDIDMDELENATFTFRMAHLLERNQYLWEHPKAMVLGAGLHSEDSKIIDKIFDFKIGLIEELTDNVIQLDTGDISYSILILRFGYLGTFLNLGLFVYLMIFFYKKRENKYGFFSFLYLILTFGVSFFSSNLVYPITFLLPLISYQIIQKTASEENVNKNRNKMMNFENRSE